MNKPIVMLGFLGIFAVSTLLGQEILTASDFFAQVARHYADLKDYTADFQWVVEEQVMEGIVYYKNPGLIRMDFTSPEDQVIVSNDEQLQVYIPRYNVVLRQKFNVQDRSNITGVLNPRGLQLLIDNYSVSYQSNPFPIPLEDHPEELVYELRLVPKTGNQGFRFLNVYIDLDLFIRKVTAIAVNDQNIVLKLSNVLLDQNLTQATFEYDSPGSANMYDGFLY